MRVDDQSHAAAALPAGKRPDTHFIGRWVAPGPVWAFRRRESRVVHTNALCSQKTVPVFKQDGMYDKHSEVTTV